VIPKTHGERLHDVPDDELAELLPAAKKLALATGAVDYNILQNNGKIAHQVVGHVHVHMVSSLVLGREVRGRGVLIWVW
jgi:diadenosine tetraphosphate (Ap4A) HIT family hydrolase